ncbi:family 16 glycosylhydrolase [Microtetraspora sp. AC03309]|uniref:glycoside hydrolase family 16 protein n=1 Tax=Microtetraspora sp. AC03309 TaxID=2779376 RepID=UPI001E560748|nr:glycoside hydrolase family 16 protein [Microtetraspora sp. AC03309]MCC5580353.1 family 16 glycosylhydrolase [Microtetraspora sp. AC03309]
MAAAMVIAAATACSSAEPVSVLTAAGESATEVSATPSAAARQGKPAAGPARTASGAASSSTGPRAAAVAHHPRPARERRAANLLPPAASGRGAATSHTGAYPDGTFSYPDDRVTVYPESTFPDGTFPDGTFPDGTFPDGTAAEGAYPDGYSGYRDDRGDRPETGYPDVYTGGDGSGRSGESPLPLGQADSSSVIHPAPGTGTGGTGGTGAGMGGTGGTGTGTGTDAASGTSGATGGTAAGTGTGTAGVAGGTGGTGGTATGSGQSTTGAEWGAPILVEDFNGTRIDESKWGVYDSPNARTNPRTSRATSVSGGMLRMTGGIYGGKDLSGGVASLLLQQYGRWEVRLRSEAGAGYSAVALLMPEQVSANNYAEVDFVEVGDIPRQLSGIFVHGSGGQRAASSMRADFTQWHTAAVDWLPDRLTFWLDGKMVWNYTGPLVPKGRTMGLALQNDVVCDGALCRNASTPATVTMYVDWVRIYRAPQ